MRRPICPSLCAITPLQSAPCLKVVALGMELGMMCAMSFIRQYVPAVVDHTTNRSVTSALKPHIRDRLTLPSSNRYLGESGA